jgi:predicted GH43/DUF377 family glycosyl hydrolase
VSDLAEPALWQLGDFARRGEVLGEVPEVAFRCPVRGERVAWAAKDVFNPGAVVRDGRVHLLVRAEDAVGRYAGTSRIGLATSDDGMAFELEPEPVLFPDDDAWQAWEWPGGCEDPRLVESPGGGYVCTYTAFDGKHAHLFVATSDDLRRWRKHGPAFVDTPFVTHWSKSGAIVTEVRDGRLVAAEIDGRYWMYWGEGIGFAATSTDLVRWTPLTFDSGDRYLQHVPDAPAGRLPWALHRVPTGARSLRPVLFPRRGRFDRQLVEPGPPAVRTDDGVVLVYNGAGPDGYQPGQALFDAHDPAAVIARATAPFLRPETRGEQHGQVDHVCFAQALVLFRDEWLLYFGMADSRVGCAAAPARSSPAR